MPLSEEDWNKLEAWARFDEWAKAKKLTKEDRQLIALYIWKKETK